MADVVDHLFIAPADFSASYGYYVNALGFEVDHVWGDDSEPRGAALRRGGVRFVLAEQHSDDVDKAWASGVNGRRPTVHIRTDDIEETHADLLSRGAEIVSPLQETHWGVTWLVARDPDDNLIAFFQEKSGC